MEYTSDAVEVKGYSLCRYFLPYPKFRQYPTYFRWHLNTSTNKSQIRSIFLDPDVLESCLCHGETGSEITDPCTDNAYLQVLDGRAF